MVKPQFVGRDQNGHAIYDLSNDKALADAGDEEAQRRLETQRLLNARNFARAKEE